MASQYLVGFLREHTRAGCLEAVLEAAGEMRSADELADDSTWSSYWQLRRLFECAGVALGAQRRLADVGLGSGKFAPKSNPEWMEMLRALGSPAVLFANTVAYASMWPILQFNSDEVGPAEFVIRQSFKNGFAPFKEFCWFFAGLHAVTPQLFGFPTGDVVEEACQCDGAPECVFRIRWEATGDSQSPPALIQQIRMLEGRLEALQRTVGDIVSGDDIGVVLTQITASAARAVPAPAYVLALEALPWATKRVYSVGLEPAEADRIAEELLGEVRRSGPRRLTVDIASKGRFYGRLAAISLENHQFLPQESVILEAYGRLAAAALDSAVALEVARVLLELSTSLAEPLCVDDMADKIVRAVRAVIDCDSAVVILLDAVTQSAGIVATSGYDAEADLRLRLLSVEMVAAEGVSVADSLLAGSALASTAVPIIVNGETIGWLAVSVTKRPDRLHDAEVAGRLRGLAGQSATAISGARLLGQIRHQALHDALTGLPNRSLILDRVDTMLARARRDRISAAAMFIDLDGFKDINDTLGHGVGDQLLQAVAARLGTTLRPSDTIGRLGGDEFVVLVEGASLDAGPELVAQRLLDVLREPFHLLTSSGPSLTVTASIGIAVGDRDSADELLRDADVALYRAKAAGKNCFEVFAPEMQTAIFDRLSLELDLRGALEAEEFFLVYQPIFDLTSCRVTGVEALLRWRHPTRGVVQPADFIPVLEETGMIIEIGRWVLREACRQAAAWRDGGYRLDLSVNVSARQLEDNRFVDDVEDAVLSNRIDPVSLTIEITETAIMRDAEATAKRLIAIKRLGVRIAIDDFGTGYSSMAYLRSFPIDTLKIDRSFVSAIAGSSDATALIHALVQLGKSLSLEVLAEGIETDEQLALLAHEGCDSGQGYLLSRPLEVDGVAAFLGAQASSHHIFGPRSQASSAEALSFVCS